MFGRILCAFIAISCFLVIVQAGVFTRNLEAARSCGYEGCPKPDPKKLNIHLVAHTHDDVGWLKTVDQYFFGGRNNIQKAGVEYILDTVVDALRKDPERRFIYVETAFLWKWWLRQNDKIREEVKTFINEGRLEIIGGAWSMNDEATTHYHSIIDQSTWGFRRLNDTFGTCARPKIGWQIDPFGHSREQASLFAQFGFDGMFFGRLDWQDKTKRMSEKSAEYIWKASSSLGKSAELFSVALFNNYSPPPGFCFDILCQDEPLIDDPKSPDYNIKSKLKSFYDYVLEQGRHYKSNNIILTMGGDFTYQLAEQYFVNLDRLIRYTNKIYGDKANVFYSTPSCYLKSVNEAGKTFPTKTDDLFPYSSDPHAFWTGYFTSRPTLKYFERLGNNFLQIVKQLAVLTNAGDSKDLELFREAMGVMQHHDAVTGTEKQQVADDYARLLTDAIVRGEKIVSTTIGKLSIRGKPSAARDFKSCLLLNVSSCQPIEDSKTFTVTLYNPRSHPVSTYVRIPVKGAGYIVKDYIGTEIVTQLIPVPAPVSQAPGRTSKATRELVFRALEIPPLGYQSFFITEKDGDDSYDEITRPENVSSIGGDLYDISVDDAGDVHVQWKNMDLRVVQSFKYYQGAKGNNSEFKNRASGAYIFRPNSSLVHDFSYSGFHKFYKGPLVEELHLIVNSYVSQVVRIYNGEDKIEFDWVAGPISVDDSIGKEIVSKFSSNLESKGVFFTDSNGREMLKRVRDFRPTWTLNLSEPVAGNYYPVTAKISLRDDAKQLRMSVLNDRAQGGSSMKDGELEVMIHRRLLNDDAFGVNEALNEQAFGKGLVARGVHYLVGSSLKDLDAAASKEKSLALSLALKPWVLVTPVENLTFEQWQSNYIMQVRGLRKRLPPNIHILTLEPWKEDQVLLRLEHLYEIGEAAQMSQPAEVNIADLFMDFDVVEVRETTLGGNQWIEDKRRLQWSSETNEGSPDLGNSRPQVRILDGAVNVLLKPMEIRTFIVSFKSLPSS
ncbi:lysosomal alpha-mannosidase isoform X2 [Diachasma alloeum]|uniref:lysosomal alpha-mannosidase isoform X2 n=1 Tax=Diachasma alloeum TaxID=454923 RepID=UPI000738499A|nr:lysosomal alpha-mannosidase isoform X2 [Diachasma alloeum]